jgi:hypothetical protein
MSGLLVFHSLFRKQHENKLRITCLAWNPDKTLGAIAYSDDAGHIGLFEDVIPAEEMQQAKVCGMIFCML